MSVKRSEFDVERSGAPGRAVFLSYASQDAEAAKRICEALRGAGVEVWFDVEGGLETGDEWDAKIRRQIKECVLFLPIISANTEARDEGYFRIEWDLAAERARGIASGVAFILPVVIDDTKEPTALVPDRFRSVQWTRARDGELTPATLAKFAKLWSHRAGLAKHRQAAEAGASATSAVPHWDQTDAPPAAAAANATAPQRKPRALWMAIASAVAAGVLAVGAVFFWRKPAEATAQETVTVAPSTPVAPAATEYPRDPELKRARALLFTTDAIPEDFALAEDIIKPIVAQRPNDPEVATVAAEVALEFLVRGFDLALQRRSQVQRLTERAAQLAPENPYAVASVGRYLLFIDAQLGRAEELTRRAIALRPGEARFHRTLYTILSRTKPAAEVNAFGERMAAQFPRDPLVAYDIARRFKDENDLVQAEKWFDRTVEHAAPPAFAFIWKSWIMLQVHCDLPAAKAWLDRVPERQRANARVANARYVHALFSGDTPHALRALGEVPDEWLTDFDFTGPKALLIGNLHLRNGRADLAKVELEAALALANAEIDKNPTDLFPRRAKMWVLISLGRLEEARSIYQVLLQATRRPYVLNFRNLGWTALVNASLLLGHRDDALTLLREAAAADANTRLVLRNMFQLDPRLTPWRDDAEIVAILAEPKPAAEPMKLATAAVADDKSVAVLAFANLSDDKANEYFSDGISEELLNVLAKVPGLKVSARTSAFYFKGKNTPIPEIAKQLGVAYVVEGSVRKAGDKVRITAQLIKAADGFRVWNDTFTRDLKDIFAVQDEIAGLVAQNLSLKLGTSSSRKVAALNPQAFEHYVQARQSWSLRTPEGFARAEQMLNRALELAPDFVRARAALIDVVQMRSLRERHVGTFGTRHSPEIDQRLAQVREVLAIDPELAEAYSTLGQTFDSKWQRDEAGQAYRRATELNPNYATGRQWYGMHLAELGYMDEALAELKAACDLDPFSFIILDNYGWLLHLAGRRSEALQMLDRAAALNPGFDQTARVKAAALQELGRTAEAEAIARRLKNNQRELDVWTLGSVGLHAEAKALLARMDPRDVSNRFQALLAAGEREAALEALADPSGASKGDTIDILYLPIFDPVRTDPRFIQYLSVLGLVEAHTRAQAWRRLHPPEKPEANR